jgi:DNA mismatch repair ATPase MutL
MMEDLSLHILDVAENSIEANARRVAIRVEELVSKDRLVLEIVDNGRGMSPEEVSRALDPFFTTKKAKRVGLGLPLLAQAARATGGKATVRSIPGRGTKVRATFRLSHIDLQPLGDVAETLTVLMVAHPEVRFRYTHKTEAGSYIFRSHSGRAQSRPRNISEIKKNIRGGIVRVRRKS